MINEETKKDVLVRLSRIEGQVGGLKKMIEEEKYCVDIINQANAVRRALEQVALKVMKRHIESCVADACECGEGGQKINELIETIDRFVR